MPDVYNWQLGRTMTYPYPEAHPQRQFAAPFNTDRCIGYQTYTGSCMATWTFSHGQEYMWWNSVETKPYGSYPQHWDVKVLQLLAEDGGSVENPKHPLYFLVRMEQIALPLYPQFGTEPNIYNDTVIGFDETNREIVRLSVVEPLHERPLERLNSI